MIPASIPSSTGHEKDSITCSSAAVGTAMESMVSATTEAALSGIGVVGISLPNSHQYADTVGHIQITRVLGVSSSWSGLKFTAGELPCPDLWGEFCGCCVRLP